MGKKISPRHFSIYCCRLIRVFSLIKLQPSLWGMWVVLPFKYSCPRFRSFNLSRFVSWVEMWKLSLDKCLVSSSCEISHKLLKIISMFFQILGIINQPILRERWIGISGRRTTLNGQELSTRSCAKLSQAYLYDYYISSEAEKKSVQEIVHVMFFPCICIFLGGHWNCLCISFVSSGSITHFFSRFFSFIFSV